MTVAASKDGHIHGCQQEGCVEFIELDPKRWILESITTSAVFLAGGS